MALPNQFTNAIATDAFRVDSWLEVEGIPNAVGTLTKGASWFAARAALQQFAQILPYFKAPPESFEAQLDVLDGIAKVAGAVDFQIVDVDGAPTGWAGAWDNTKTLELSANITEAATSLTVTTTPDTTYYPTGGGTLYIGNETIAYTALNTGTKTFSGLTRGKYRSKAQAWWKGAIASHKPYVMFGRRVWYYQIATATNGAPSTAPVDADKVLRFSGTVENLRLADNDLGTYVLTCVSLEKELTRDVFRDLRQVRDLGQRGIVGSDLSKPGIRLQGQAGGNSYASALAEDVSQKDENGGMHFTDGLFYLFKVDNEVLVFSANTGNTGEPDRLYLSARGALGTQIEEHSAGFTLQEIAWCARYISTSDLHEHLYTRFTSTPNAVCTVAGDHPLIVLLCLMLSTGTGTNIDGGRNYDVLPESWGLGIPFERVDVRGIEQLANEFPDYAISGFWDSPTKFIDVAKECLAPFGFFGLTLVGDQWTVRKLRPPFPDETTRTIDTRHIISKSSPGWDGNLLGLVQEVEFYYNADLGKKFLNHTVFVNSLGKQYAQGRGRRLKYQLPHVYARGPTAIPGRPGQGGMPNIELVLQERLEFFRQGFTLPPPIISLRVRYDFLDVEPGDLVAISINSLPRVQAGVRGMTDQTMRCLRKTVDEGSRTVELTFQDTGYGVGDFGYISPACMIDYVDDLGLGTLVLKGNYFTSTKGPDGVTTQYDSWIIDRNGTPHDWVDTQIQQTADITVVSADFKNVAQLAVASWSGGYDPGPVIELPGFSALSWYTQAAYLLPNTSAEMIQVFRQWFYTYLSNEGAALLDTGAAYRFYP